jgi:hypothetical protein
MSGRGEKDVKCKIGDGRGISPYYECATNLFIWNRGGSVNGKGKMGNGRGGYLRITNALRIYLSGIEAGAGMGNGRYLRITNGLRIYLSGIEAGAQMENGRNAVFLESCVLPLDPPHSK